MKIVCASTTCKYASEEEDSTNVIFISFPNNDTSKLWAHNCNRLDLLSKSNEELHSNYYICSHHIEDHCFISKCKPITIAQGTVPTVFQMEPVIVPLTPVTSEKAPEYENQHSKDNIQSCDSSLNSMNNIEGTDNMALNTNFHARVLNHESVDEKNNTVTIFNRCVSSETSDNDALRYCDINTEIEQYSSVTIGFSSLCRICGDEASDGIEIYSAKGIELKLRYKIQLHLPISIDVEDIMPQRLCINCYNKLEVTHSLITTCLQTNMRFRRFLNIEGMAEYDKRFDALVEECSLEVAEEICDSDTIQSKTISLVSKKNEESEATNKVECNLNKCSATADLEHTPIAQITAGGLNVNDVNKLKFTVDSNSEVHSDLSDLFHVFKGIKNKENECVIETVSEAQKIVHNKEESNLICLLCKDTFKTVEIFENHKILCDDGDALDLKQQKESSNSDNLATQPASTIDFQFSMKSCDVCGKVFETEALLQDHEISCCQPFMQYSCHICDQQFANKEEFVLHEQLHVPVNNVTTPVRRCGYCQATFHTRKELQNHIMKYHGGQTLFKCNICDKAYEKWSSLDVHEATHRLDKPFLCDLCGKSFKHSNNLRGHKRIHLEESKKKRHVCELCGNAFRSRFHLNEHMNQHNGNKPYGCEQCGKAFYKRIQLRQHKLSHGLNKFACPICGVTFNRRGNMNTHFKRHSTQDGVYTCSVCEHRCKSMSDLKIHRKEHSEEDIMESVKKKAIDKTVWQCRICARVFLKRTIWLNHERSHTGEKVSVECDECGKKLASKSSLTYHKKSIHSSERPHMCQFCGDSFVSKEARLIHERIHTGERPYVCKICNMQYRCSSNLSQHMKIHSEARPHVCPYCNKGFTRKGALNVHERIHTGVKPFACVVCGRNFSQKNDMLKHTKTHRVKSIRCEQCDEVFATKREILKHIAVHEQNVESSVIQRYVDMPQHVESYSINIPYSNIEESDELVIAQNN
ncbi:zinc finger protein 585A [Cephus cinctus]|uniref:Zinc finger protein 585A n=1 Tax=Cephus cinctus TaxID=211228 RepID=A0AAJ7BZD2_CEPCN|nr:zinc finger protein 585A [Cephus cinctus]